jgi:hypothetical protein
MLTTLLGFLVSLATILVLSKKNLAVALISGAVILGLFTLPMSTLLERVIHTVTDVSVILLALAMGIIPMLGGTMKESGQVDSLVNNVRLSKRYLLPFSASLMGLLPMPGGALLSAPIVERAGAGVVNDLKAVINNWFRHLFILIYPLSSALIVSAEITGLDVYRAVLYLLPAWAVALILGYTFFLRRVQGRPSYSEKFSWTALSLPLLIILSAPVIDFTLKRTLSIGTLATLIGVSTGLALSIVLSRRKLALKTIALRMKPWNFSLIIVGMFMYLHIFQASDARNLITSLPLPPLTLSVTTGFLLGLATGRVQLPASIVFPIYLATVQQISPVAFVLIYAAMYFGYVTSPVHPCLIVTCEYFHVPIRSMIRELAWPTVIVISAAVVISLVVAH